MRRTFCANAAGDAVLAKPERIPCIVGGECVGQSLAGLEEGGGIPGIHIAP